MHSVECPADQKLRHFLDDVLTDEESSAVEHHVSLCEACEKKLAGMSLATDKCEPNSDFEKAVKKSAHAIPHDDDEPPTLPDIRVRQVLGRGGMGVVFRVFDERLRRESALKTIRKKYKEDAELTARFLDEMNITAQLQHPGIVPVYEKGTLDDGRPYYLMKIVKGHTLKSVLVQKSNRDFDLLDLVSLFAKTCEAVGYAHSRGIIHRDLKPDNIMVGAFGEVQIMDWGLAKKVAGSPESDGREPNQPSHVATEIETLRAHNDYFRTQGALGTYPYMAPEQAAGELSRVREATDVFSLGSILAEILTGKPAYVPSTPDQDPRPLALRADLGPVRDRLETSGAPTELSSLCKQCLSIEPGMRPSNATQLATAVSEYIATTEQKRRSAELDRIRAEADRELLLVNQAATEKARRTRVAFFTVTLLVLAISTAAIWRFWRELAENRQAHLKATQSRTEQARLLADRVALELPKLNANLDRVADDLAVAGELVIGGVSDAEQISGRLARAKKDHDMLVRLRNIDNKAAQVLEDGVFLGRGKSSPEYAKAFEAYGIDVYAINAKSIVEAVDGSAIRLRLINAMEIWWDVAKAPQLLQAINTLDNDPTRVEIRNAIAASDFAKLYVSLSRCDFSEMPPAFAIAVALHPLTPKNLSEKIFAEASLAHPTNFDLALNAQIFHAERRLNASSSNAESFGRTGLALEPHNSACLTNIGNAIYADESGDSVWKLRLAERIFERAVAADPKNAAPRIGLGNVWHKKRDFEKAEKHFRSALEINPGLRNGLYGLALTLWEAKKTQASLDCCNELTRLHPEDPRGFLLKARCLAILDHFEAAEAEYRNAEAKSTNDLSIPLELEALLRRMKRLDDADAVLKNLRAKFPDHAEIERRLGLSFFSRKMYEDAASLLKSCDHRRIAGFDEYYALGASLRKIGKSEEAILALKQAVSRVPSDSRPSELLGKILLERGDKKGAMEYLRSALRSAPVADLRKILVELAVDERREQNQFKQLIFEYEKKLLTPTKLNDLGWKFHGVGDVETAIFFYDQALSKEPSLEIARCNLIDVLTSRNELKNALLIANHGLELDRGSTHLHRRRSDIHRYERRWKESIEAYHESLRFQATNASAWWGLGKVHDDKGDRDSAIRILKKGVLAVPENEPVRHLLANTLAKAGTKERAATEFARSLKLNPKCVDLAVDYSTFLFEKGDKNETIRVLRKAVSDMPDRAVLRRHLGWRLKSQGDFRGGVFELTEAARLDPKDSWSHENLGYAFRGIGDSDQALASIRTAVDLRPGSANLRIELAYSLAEKQMFDLAINESRTAVKLATSNHLGHARLGYYLRVKGDYEGSRDALAEAIRIAPDVGWYHIELSRTLQETNQSDAATRAVERSIELKPSEDGFVVLANIKGRKGAHLAVGVLEDAAKKDKALLEQRGTMFRYTLACWLVGSAGGSQVGREELGRSATELRTTARLILREDLGHLKQRLADGKSDATVTQRLAQWLTDPWLAKVRDWKALPNAEQESWASFWQDVRACQQQPDPRTDDVRRDDKDRRNVNDAR